MKHNPNPKSNPWIEPSWPAPKNVKALSTLRFGGFSVGPYESLNLSFMEDDPKTVLANRKLLEEKAELPGSPLWLHQVHGIGVLDLSDFSSDVSSEDLKENSKRTADASMTSSPNLICAVTTADCLPILVCNKAGTEVAAIHAGWRGLASGVIEATIRKFNDPKDSLLVWLGPAISQEVYEVGEEVREAFTHQQDKNAFIPSVNEHKWKLDLYQAARHRLEDFGIQQIFGGDFCTFRESDRFFSARRSGKNSGRFASLIWISDNS